jgi:hypothetical protein
MSLCKSVLQQLRTFALLQRRAPTMASAHTVKTRKLKAYGCPSIVFILFIVHLTISQKLKLHSVESEDDK